MEKFTSLNAARKQVPEEQSSGEYQKTTGAGVTRSNPVKTVPENAPVPMPPLDRSPFKNTERVSSIDRPKSEFFTHANDESSFIKAVSQGRYRLFNTLGGTRNQTDPKQVTETISKSAGAFEDLSKRGVRIAKTSYIIGRPPGSDDTAPPTLLSVIEKIDGEDLRSKSLFTIKETSQIDRTFAACLDHMRESWATGKPVLLDHAARQFLYTKDGPVLIDTDPVILQRVSGRDPEHAEKLFWMSAQNFVEEASRVERNAETKFVEYRNALKNLLIDTPSPTQWQARYNYNILFGKLDPEFRALYILDKKALFLKRMPTLRRFLGRALSYFQKP